MYHGLRKALTTGVNRAVAKDGRVAAVEEAYVRLDKCVESLVWALDNCEATWRAQAAFLQHLPTIASEIYSATDVASGSVVRATTDAAAALGTSVSTPALAGVRAELNALRERVQRLDAQRTEWTRALSDQKYYDEKYQKLLAATEPDREREKDREKRAEKERRALLKKAQASDDVNALSLKLADEFDSLLREKLAVADRVLLAVFNVQCTNAGHANVCTVRDIAMSAQFGARSVPLPARDENLPELLTGIISDRRRLSNDYSLTPSHSEPTLPRPQTPPAPPPDYAPPQRIGVNTASHLPSAHATAHFSSRPVSAPSSHSWDHASRPADGLVLDFSAVSLSDTRSDYVGEPTAPPPPQSPGAESTYIAVNGLEMEFATRPPLH